MARTAEGLHLPDDDDDDDEDIIAAVVGSFLLPTNLVASLSLSLFLSGLWSPERSQSTLGQINFTARGSRGGKEEKRGEGDGLTGRVCRTDYCTYYVVRCMCGAEMLRLPSIDPTGNARAQEGFLVPQVREGDQSSAEAAPSFQFSA